ncbi:MAG TPA: CAAD domain-containing protein [Coleofasciculaceae cyanobacterium]
MSEEIIGNSSPLDRQIETTEKMPLGWAFPDLQWKQSPQQIATFFTAALANPQDIFQAYKPLLRTLAWVLLAWIGFKILWAVLDAIQDIPLFSTLMELVGFGYTDWFIFRYLIKAADRQELSEKIEHIKREVLGEPAISRL